MEITQNIELACYELACPNEQLRKPRLVRVGLFQHKIPLPTWSPIKEMRDALFKLASEVVELASEEGVNVFCFQEAWSKYFYVKVVSNVSTYVVIFRYAVCFLHS